MPVDSLPPELQASLNDAIAHPPSSEEKAASAPDAMQYFISVGEGGSQRELHFDDTTMPPSLQPLLSHLSASSAPMPLT